MTKLKTALLASTSVVALVAAGIAPPAFAGKGNGVPSGAHYNLTIIGSTQAPNSTMTGSNRHTIIMPLVTAGDSVNGSEPDGSITSDTSIFLEQTTSGDATDFRVCDGNGFDVAYQCSPPAAPLTPVRGSDIGATFQLPCNTSVTGNNLIACTGNESDSYEVWVEALGKPGGSASLTTCGITSTGTEYCNSTNTVLVRTAGKPKFTNATQNLTTVTTKCLSGTGKTGTCTYELFAPEFDYYLWDYDNNGLRNAQLRFYDMSGENPNHS